MGIGYVIGCLLSLLMWKFDRQNVINILNERIKKIIKNKVFIQVLYVILLCAISYLLHKIRPKELYNFITAFLAVDISNTEKKNLRQRDKVRFYDSISIISRAVVSGFIAPFAIIILFGNTYAIAYMLIYNISTLDEEFDIFKFCYIFLTIIPALIAEVFLYIVYLCRNKRSNIDFKGDYFINLFMRPLLNVDILGAYVESVNFYYLYSYKNTDYLKGYGEYTKKIDDVCVKDYLSIAYGICLICFIMFYLLIK